MPISFSCFRKTNRGQERQAENKQKKSYNIQVHGKRDVLGILKAEAQLLNPL